ncbi:MAG: hypothetical protein ACN4GZ_11690, partial [Acidimicrobiales bacterium]
MNTTHHIQRRTGLALLFAIMIAFVGLAASTAAAAPGPRTKPFRVTQQAEFETVGTCDFGAPLQRITGVGHSTHLGRFES